MDFTGWNSVSVDYVYRGRLLFTSTEGSSGVVPSLFSVPDLNKGALTAVQVPCSELHDMTST